MTECHTVSVSFSRLVLMRSKMFAYTLTQVNEFQCVTVRVCVGGGGRILNNNVTYLVGRGGLAAGTYNITQHMK